MLWLFSFRMDLGWELIVCRLWRDCVILIGCLGSDLGIIWGIDGEVDEGVELGGLWGLRN